MTSRIIFLSLFLCLSLHAYEPCDGIAFAEQEFFPFLAEVTGDQINVRSGQSANFERLCQLNKGDEVVVISKGYSWYKIQLPSSAKSFVSKEYVQFLGQNAGGVTANRVNIRAGAGIQYTILGQLIQGEQIYILEDLDEWYRIQPMAKSYGWVSDQYLVFKSKDVVKHQIALPPIPPAIKESPEPMAEQQQEEKKVEKVEGVDNSKEAVGAQDKGIVSFIGYVESYEDDEAGDVHYKIVASGQPVCYVQGPNHMLGRFMNRRVTVEGTVNQRLRPKYTYPVIIISKIKLML